MLKKYENKCFNSQIIHDKILVIQGCRHEIFSFLTEINKKLLDSQMEILFREKKDKKDILQNSLEITTAINDIKKIECRTKKEAQELIDQLEKLLNEVNKKVITFDNIIGSDSLESEE